MCRRLLPLACAVAALSVGITACGEDREGSVEQSGAGTETTGTTASTGTSTSPTASRARPVATVNVKETEYKLSPENPKVAKVGVVSFDVENAGKITHSLEVEGPGGEVETEGIRAGASATLKADLSKPGTYEWYCPISDHKARGMKGRITVAGGGSGASKDDSGRRGGDFGGRRDDSGGRGDFGGRRDDSGRRGDDFGRRREDFDRRPDDSGERRGADGRGSGVY